MLLEKLINIITICKSCGIAKVAIFSVLPCKDLDTKSVDETNNYLKDLCGFYGFPFIDNSNITEKIFASWWNTP